MLCSPLSPAVVVVRPEAKVAKHLRERQADPKRRSYHALVSKAEDSELPLTKPKARVSHSGSHSSIHHLLHHRYESHGSDSTSSPSSADRDAVAAAAAGAGGSSSSSLLSGHSRNHSSEAKPAPS